MKLCDRIPEIGVRVVRQGALPLLEKALHVKSGHAVKLVNIHAWPVKSIKPYLF